MALVAQAGCGEAEPVVEPLKAEAGFIELPPISYSVRGGAQTADAITSAARLFFSFRPADEAPLSKPIIVLTSGGPGASTAILLGGNTGPTTLDKTFTNGAQIAKNEASWTAFASLLYIDARGTGFSYGLVESAGDPAVFADEFSVRNFNSFVDAADLVRVVLRFLDERPSLRSLPIVLAGESYSGIRTSLALHMFHFPDRYGPGAEPFEDAALAGEISAHFDEAGTTAGEQLSRSVLLQPRLTSPQQQAAAGAALEAEGSPLFQIAEETGVPFVPCSEAPSPCSPFPNAVAYLEAAGRDLYDVRRPAGETLARYAEIGARLEEPEVLGQALGDDPFSIAELAPAAREDAYRLAEASPADEPLTKKLGALAPHDRYFEVELFDLIGAPFAGAPAKALGIERQNERYGRYFLEDARSVRFLVTNAAFDAAIWTPSLPAALQMYTTDVSSVHIDGQALTIEYAPGAFGAPGGTTSEVRFVPFDGSGHSVSLDEPAKLSAVVHAFLVE